MTISWSRLTARIGALRHHRVVTAARELLRQAVSHPAWRRAGCRLARHIPPGLVHRWQSLRARHPRLASGAVPLTLLVLVAVSVLFWVGHDYMRVKGPGDAALPDLESIEDTTERKQAFIGFLRPVVEYENARVLEQRKRLLKLLERLESGREPAASESAWLAEQAERYRVKADDDLTRARRLRNRIDIVPTSLALAQGALESGWGTSRFARQGNNLFGQWCFDAGCGIVPRQRPAHAGYEVETFDTVGEAVRSYMRNLNSHPAYAPVRRIRAEARREGRQPTGMEMAAGLVNYAAIGETYVEHIRTVIRRNNLHRLAQADG